MSCIPATFPGGSRGFVCTGRQKPKRCACGAPGTRDCDWILARPEGQPPKTCDRPICTSCSTSPAPDKDLCPEHAKAFEAWLARRHAGAPS